MSSVHASPAAGPLVFISAAEPSADLHGASLIRAVRELAPAVRFVGVAGPQMRLAGCESIYDMTGHAAMLGGIFRRIPQALTMLWRARCCLRREPCDLAVVIDSPVLHIPLARSACSAKVPVLYFIAPQLWAWAEWRIRRLRRRVQRLAVILPFEEAYFRGRGLHADYVGHPLFDALARRTVDATLVAATRARGNPVISLLPGSRTHVVREVLPGQLQVAAAIARRFPQAHFCVSLANSGVVAAAEPLLTASGLSCSRHTGENGEILSASDLALVASGTATLETAYYHTPMIVMYNASRLGYYLVGRWLISTARLSLINILAGRELVPEFMPFYRSVEPIAQKALELLDDPARLGALRAEIAATMTPMVKTGAARNTAALLVNMLRERGRDPGGAAVSAPGAASVPLSCTEGVSRGRATAV